MTLNSPTLLHRDQIIHLWILDLNVEPFLNAIPQDEIENCLRQKTTLLKRRALSCRSQVRQVLSKYTKEKPNGIEIQKSEYGKPFLKNKNFFFNLSHCDDTAILGISFDGEIGVDLEIKKNLLPCPNAFMSTKEKQELFFIRPELQNDHLLKCWVRKESYLKMLGFGFSVIPEDFYVGISNCQNIPIADFQIENQIFVAIAHTASSSITNNLNRCGAASND